MLIPSELSDRHVSHSRDWFLRFFYFRHEEGNHGDNIVARLPHSSVRPSSSISILRGVQLSFVALPMAGRTENISVSVIPEQSSKGATMSSPTLRSLRLRSDGGWIPNRLELFLVWQFQRWKLAGCGHSLEPMILHEFIMKISFLLDLIRLSFVLFSGSASRLLDGDGLKGKLINYHNLRRGASKKDSYRLTLAFFSTHEPKRITELSSRNWFSSFSARLCAL